MFEKLIRINNSTSSDDVEADMYFGHVYKPTDFDNIDSLRSWNEVDRNEKKKGEVIAVGTLMRIVDFRRRVDGKLLILVQGIDRFVFTSINQDTPYGIANVQIVPDFDEQVTKSDDLESFDWYDYEFDNSIRLPLPTGREITISDIHGPSLAMLMPLSPIGETTEANKNIHSYSSLKKFERKEENQLRSLLDSIRSRDIFEYPSLPLEETSYDDLEYRLWLKIDEYLRITNRSVPKEILPFLPNISFPSSFQLKNSRSLDKDYPSHRRWKRLSYFAPSLIETEQRSKFRQQLLEISTTKERLR